jgi:hypothetical protein
LKRMANSVLSFLILFGCFSVLSEEVHATSGATKVQEATFASGVVIYDNQPAAGKFISEFKDITPEDVTINLSDAVSSIELRTTSGAFKATMTNIGGNKYHLDTPISGEELLVDSVNKATIYNGYFDWFRDPNKKTWMYDYDEPPTAGQDPTSETETNRYYRTTTGEFSQPPPGTCQAAITSTTAPFPTSFPDSQPCNEA